MLTNRPSRVEDCPRPSSHHEWRCGGGGRVQPFHFTDGPRRAATFDLPSHGDRQGNGGQEEGSLAVESLASTVDGDLAPTFWLPIPQDLTQREPYSCAFGLRSSESNLSQRGFVPVTIQGPSKKAWVPHS